MTLAGLPGSKTNEKVLGPWSKKTGVKKGKLETEPGSKGSVRERNLGDILGKENRCKVKKKPDYIACHCPSLCQGDSKTAKTADYWKMMFGWGTYTWEWLIVHPEHGTLEPENQGKKCFSEVTESA